MTVHEFTFAPDRHPAIHPSGRIVNLPTGLTRATCRCCGASFTINSHDEPQRLFPGRDTLFVVQRACT